MRERRDLREEKQKYNISTMRSLSSPAPCDTIVDGAFEDEVGGGVVGAVVAPRLPEGKERAVGGEREGRDFNAKIPAFPSHKHIYGR